MRTFPLFDARNEDVGVPERKASKPLVKFKIREESQS